MATLDSASFTTQQLRRGLILLGAVVLMRAVLVGTFWDQPDPAADPFGFGLLVLVAFLVGSAGIVYFGFTRWVGVDLKGWWIDPDELRGDLLWGLVGIVVVFILFGVFALVMMFGLGMEPPEQVPPSAVGFALILVFGFAVRAFQEETLFRGFLQTAFENRFGPWQANVLQAFVFAIAHIGYIPLSEWPMYVLIFVFGVVFGWLRMRRGRLLAPAIAHGFGA
ncbi:CPBP family intramembrane glutamic endopeptidase [Halorubrum vacuolatum]|uniref:Membrane protease YdiL, CAAX protease family n=1 Tax=Halorubrum vacuolatum TaxID=63740 RepID=A0A238WC33_HALVU|nr:type II CAAX endopeptidase family protein [Halorubrum vacuolatum]SNR44048.1 Membrane protease YdiL, CAAX protease family [Halorubrum vacuolatum]